ncbi:hypothetical protein EUGRSUZ_L01070 [Eucalyptus grandis]|uniref:Uncharacterized protein n=1 Tax=Eucalyptus grandis TaxID=71139 RepID=A0A058ZTY7_EUCGR|nr:hypothetical protein EUGRSUZ_L01070 [Eucalyptus grandis]
MDHSAHLMETDKQGISATRIVGTEPSLGSSKEDFKGWGRGVSMDAFTSRCSFYTLTKGRSSPGVLQFRLLLTMDDYRRWHSNL